MIKEVYRYKHFVVLDTTKDLVVKNDKGHHENHAHFNRRTNKKGVINLEAVKTCISLVNKKKIPKSSYMLTAVKRLTDDINFKEDLERIDKNRKTKSKYFNSQKGLRSV